MYSVLILNAETQQEFEEYRPLFARAIENGEIGICSWTESGDTAESAVPDLEQLTNDKEEWRAIIVRPSQINRFSKKKQSSDPDRPNDYRAKEENPYDYLIHKDSANLVEESPVPLIRLTNLLGGLPRPEKNYDWQMVRESNPGYKKTKSKLQMVEDPMNAIREEQYQKLKEKYHFDGTPPSSILLVSLRADQEERDLQSSAWTVHKESESSEFWKRNHYPSITRFLVYDIVRRGPVQKAADDYNFWLCVRLLAQNKIDPSTLQAYRLYSMKAEIDREKMEAVLREKKLLLNDTAFTIKERIRRQNAKVLGDEDKIPDYKVVTAVPIKLPGLQQRSVNTRTFPVAARNTLREISQFSTQTSMAQATLNKAIKTAERTLDRTAESMRPQTKAHKSYVEPLNPYVREDMQEETDRLYLQIIREQGDLPSKMDEDDPVLQDAYRKVVRKISHRLHFRPALITLGAMMLLMILTTIPSWRHLIDGDTAQYHELIELIIFEALFVLSLGIGTMIYQKYELNTLIGRWNRRIAQKFTKISTNAKDYSNYLSHIGSLSKGTSWIEISDQLISGKNGYMLGQHVHLREISKLNRSLASWAEAHYLDLDLSEDRAPRLIDVDSTTVPASNPIYFLDNSSEKEISLNHSGLKVDSPFQFLKGFEIIREEIYDLPSAPVPSETSAPTESAMEETV